MYMKRVLCLLLALLMCSCVSIAEHETTEKKNAFEFCDIYGKFLNEIGKIDGADYSFTESERSVSYNIIPIPFAENVQTISIPAGTLFISVPEFEVVGISCIVQDVNQSMEENAKTLARAIAAYAALEYDWEDDRIYDLLWKIDSKRFQSPAQEAIFEFNKKYLTTVQSGRFRWYTLRGLDSTDVAMLSGNYDYALRYVADEGWIMLIVEAHE